MPAHPEKTEYLFSLCGRAFCVFQGSNGMWAWECGDDQSKYFATAAEAQQDAIRFVGADDESEGGDDEDDGYLSYKSQHRSAYYSDLL